MSDKRNPTTSKERQWIRRLRVLAARMSDAAARSEHGDERARNLVMRFNLGVIVLALVLLSGIVTMLVATP